MYGRLSPLVRGLTPGAYASLHSIQKGCLAMSLMMNDKKLDTTFFDMSRKKDMHMTR